MARNPIGFGPMGIPSLEADPAQAAQPKKPADPIGALATKYQVPRNVLMALEEKGEDLETSAASIAAKVKGGGKLEDAVPRAVMVRAYDIADALDGIEPTGGIGKAIGVGVDTIQQSYGSAIEGVGKTLGIEGVEKYGREVADFNAAEAASRSRGMTRLDDVDGLGAFGKFAGETAAQQVPQMGTTLGGAAAGAAIGSPLGPVGVAVGGAAGALAANIPFFYGQNRERQREADIDAGRPVDVSEGAAFLSSIPQAGLDAFGDLIAATGVGLGPSVLARGGSGLLTRVVAGAGKGAVAGATVEVPTEIGQSMIERAQAGLPLFSDDAMKEYLEVGVAAGLIGTGLGGAGGGIKAYRTGTGAGREEEEQNPGGDGSADGQGTGPVAAPPPGGAGPVPDNFQAPPDGPTGPIGRAAAAAPDLTPQPEAEPQAPRFPDLKTGQQIQLRDPETGEILPAVFLGEEDGTPMVRLPSSPDPVDIDPALFNDMYVGGQAAGEDSAAPKSKSESAPLADLPEMTPAELLVDHFDERVAILEYDGGLTREEAEARAAQSTLAMMGQMDPAALADDRIRQLEASLTAMASAVKPDEAAAPPAPAAEPTQPQSPAPSAPPAAPAPEVAPNRVPPPAQPAPSPDAPPKPPTPPAPPAGAVAGPEQTTPPVAPPAPESAPSPSAALTQDGAIKIENIRAKAAILRGVPQDAPPQVDGVSLKWDAKEGGFIFSRKHVEKVRAALSQAASVPAPQVDQGPQKPEAQEKSGQDQPGASPVAGPKEPEAQQPAAPPVEDDRKLSKRKQAREAGRAAAKAGEDRTPPAHLNEELGREWLAGYADESAKRPFVATADNFPIADSEAGNPGYRARMWLEAASDDLILEVSARGNGLADNWLRRERQRRKIGDYAEKLKEAEDASKEPTPATPVDEPAAPTAEDIDKAAAETDPNPTPAQAEAENYRTGKVEWRGLTLSIENKKGSIRRGYDADGNETWSVEMPANYGRILGTTGADGDHVDFYMGENPDSESVWIVDQIDPDTGKFDEHKTLLGFKNKRAAIKVYDAAFSDGSGPSRRGAVTETTVGNFKQWLEDPEAVKKPVGKLNKPAQPQKAKEETAAPDTSPFENAGMAAGKGGETAWFRKQAEPGGVASYKAKMARSNGKVDWRLSRDFIPSGNVTPPPTRQFGTVGTPADAVAQLRENGMRVGKIEEAASEAAPEKADTYGAANKLVTADRAAELRARLKAKLGTELRAGIDPEIIAIGTELAVFHIEAGARRFLDFAKAVADDLGTTPQKLRPYLRSWYNGARDMIEDSGESIDGMDDAAAVRAALAKIDKPSPPEAKQGTLDFAQPEEVQDADRVDAGDVREEPAKDAGDRKGRREAAGKPSARDDQADARDSGAQRPAEGRSERRADAEREGVQRGAGRVDGRVDRGAPQGHVIAPGDLEVTAGEKTRARNSVEAIRTLRKIQAEGRPATAEERAKLALYGGAGTLAGALPRSDGSVKHEDIAADLRELLSDEEYRTLSKTSQYAFYTAESVLRSMWTMAQRLGFKGGKVYEPGMGVGGFVGTMPNDLRADTRYTGLELDLVTAQIAAALYPKSRIKQGDFIQQKLPQGYYDLVIGNPPFAGTKVQADEDYPQGFMIHDYFFAKSIDAVRPGGLLLFVTSAGTMNKLDQSARQYLADRADLVGAVRLPNTAFKENGTEVTTDIVILRKRDEGEAASDGPRAWVESDSVEFPNPDGGTGWAPVNRYFAENPDMILGEQGLYDKLSAGKNRIGVIPRDGADLRADLAAAIDKLPSDIMSARRQSDEIGAMDGDSPEQKAGSYYVRDGKLFQFDGRVGKEVARRSRENTKGMSKADFETVTALVPVKEALREVYDADLSGRDATAARKRLNDAYDAFVAKRGPINLEVRSVRRPSIVEQEAARQQAFEDARAAGEDFDQGSFDPGPMLEEGASLAQIARARAEARRAPDYREGSFDPETMEDKIVVKRPNIEPFSDDPESYRLRSIEKYDAETDTGSKTRVFFESAVTKSVTPKINSPEDALLHILAETGRVDIGRIADLSGSKPETVKEELKGKVFLNPDTREWETRAKYLSGNVRKKLRAAQEAARSSSEYQSNVEELEKVQPAPIPTAEIRVPLGAHWFPPEVYSDWAKSLGMKMNVKYREVLGLWEVDGTEGTAASENEYGTIDLPFGKLMRLVMNNRPIKVTRTERQPDGSTTSYTDEEATQAANDKAAELRERFSQWFWEDDARARDMHALYNEVFNAEVAPIYDGGYLTTPGIHSDWRWRPHQTAVVARILQDGSTYMAHTVGAGKTSAMIGAVMESRRLGLWSKPMIVVPNHMLAQFATEFYQQYPLANILVADEKRFHTSTRKQFIADAALGDWDAIIITHSGFGKIPPSEAARKAAVEDMLSEIREVLDGAGGGDRGENMATERAILGALQSIASTLGVDVKDATEGKVSTRKKIERLLEAAEQRMQRQISTRGKDQVFDFDEMGVDALLVDEAHLFRKLSFITGLGAVNGIDPAGSNMSMDLFIKTRSVDKVNPGRSLILASGTPITNTMAEAFSISRYLQPEALKERGVGAFDGWAATFGTVSSDLEQTPDGGYKEVSRFSKFVNTPELSLMMRQVMDVVSSKDLDRYVTRPTLKGGKRDLVVVEATPALKAYQQALGARMKAIQNRKGPVKKGDDIILSVINDGRLAAIDMRLVDPDSTGEGSKLEKMISNIHDVWENGHETPFFEVKDGGGYKDRPAFRGPSAQIVFSTLGINGSKHNPDFKVHRYIKAELVRRGVPARDIVLAEDLKTHAQKQRAFGDLREGKKRILIGSKSLFTGVNAQTRLAAIHNLDPLWFPADDEQRNGRGIRQGNMNREIAVFDYSTKGTYDATMWQMMGRKASFIEAFFRGDPDMREIEDLGEASVYEQAKAVSTADPRVLELTELKAERDTLQRRAAAVDRQRANLEYEISSAKRMVEVKESDIRVFEEARAKVEDLSGDKFKMLVQGEEVDKRKNAGNALIDLAGTALGERGSVTKRPVGNISGFPVALSTSKAFAQAYFTVRMDADMGIEVEFTDDPVGLVRRLENAVQEIPTLYRRAVDSKERYERQVSEAEASLANVKDFADGRKLLSVKEKIGEIERQLLAEAKAENDADKEMRGWTEIEADPEMTPADVRAVTAEVNAELARSIPGGKIKVKVVRELVSRASGRPIEGRQTGRQIEVKADAQVGAVGVMRHEIVHALRDGMVWGQPYGLFTKAEWQGLVRAARSNPDRVAAIEERYPDLPTASKSEEMVAEMYRQWAEGRDRASPSAKTFVKIRSFLMALANALRGRGFVSASRTMEQIATGKVGGRGPQGPGGGNRLGREMRAGAAEDIKAAWDGARLDTPVVLGRLPAVFRALSGKDNQLVVSAAVIKKAGSHGLTLDDVQAAIAGLDDPVMVFDSTNESGNLTALVEAAAVDGRSMVVAVDATFSAGRIEISRIATIHGKGHDGAIVGWVRDGYLRYINKKKADAWSRSRGRQLPKDGTTKHRLGVKILQHRDVFKAGDTGKEMRAPLGAVREKFSGLVGDQHWQSPSEWMSSRMTDWMASKNLSSLALAPGRALFAELGKTLHSARAYLRTKEEMDALRNEWHNRAAERADEWLGLQSKDAEANSNMMDLMHRATLAGIDPTKPSPVNEESRFLMRARAAYDRDGDSAPNWVKEAVSEADTKQRSYDRIRAIYDALPREYQALFRKIMRTYEMLANDFDKAVEANIKNAARISLKKAEKEHRKELGRIRDEGLDGPEKEAAIAAADAKLAKVKKRAGMGVKAKIRGLRQQFESQRLKGPYFPLARFGDFWVTVRDEDGKVISFARFEREKDQKRHIDEMEEQHPGRVSFGLMRDKAVLRDQVDPKFVADVEGMLSDADASPELMDAIWQRYLETMPDQSIRTSKIHRKGRAGYNRDALRAFTSHMFHGAHQLARLQYGMNLEEHIDDAFDEAARAPNPNRMTAVVNEMARRKEWTLNPTSAAWSAAASSLAFVWYLGVSPAAALVNLSQTTVIGPGVMKAAFRGVKTGKILSELSRAAKDFGKGRGETTSDLWTAENSPDITRDEYAALQEGYRRGTIDRTQAYDLAAVAETGIEYNPIREKWMRKIGWFFHHAERLNREVTYLANYRIAREQGLDHDAAIEKAADLTWKIHFSYQNSDRPRFMQGDWPKLFLQFRQFTVNNLYRLFRDLHQSLKGATEADRAEAKTQLIGISLSMMAHAGIKGVWGYGLIMGLLSIFFPGDKDDLEEWLHDALLMEEDTPGAAAWNYAMGAALNGVPGQITGTSLSERIGMPNLWFRDSFRDLEGVDLVQHYVNEMLGPTVSIAFSLGRGAQYLGEGDVVRGIEASVPKFIRDPIRAGRYLAEGVNTRNGDPLIENVNPWEALVQASGFTPARVAERYDINSRLKNQEKRIMDRRSDLHRAAGDAVRAGEPIPEGVMKKIRAFNAEFPEYPITGDTLRASIRGRMRASDRNEFGVSLNPKLNDRLRGELAPSIYN